MFSYLWSKSYSCRLSSTFWSIKFAEERQQNRRPYWIEVDPTNLYGWRLDRESNYGNLIQARIAEKAVLPDGDFGEKVYDQIRVIEPGRYRVFRKKEQIEEMYDVSDNSVTWVILKWDQQIKIINKLNQWRVFSW